MQVEAIFEEDCPTMDKAIYVVATLSIDPRTADLGTDPSRTYSDQQRADRLLWILASSRVSRATASYWQGGAQQQLSLLGAARSSARIKSLCPWAFSWSAS